MAKEFDGRYQIVYINEGGGSTPDGSTTRRESAVDTAEKFFAASWFKSNPKIAGIYVLDRGTGEVILTKLKEGV